MLTDEVESVSNEDMKCPASSRASEGGAAIRHLCIIIMMALLCKEAPLLSLDPLEIIIRACRTWGIRLFAGCGSLTRIGGSAYRQLFDIR